MQKRRDGSLKSQGFFKNWNSQGQGAVPNWPKAGRGKPCILLPTIWIKIGPPWRSPYSSIHQIVPLGEEVVVPVENLYERNIQKLVKRGSNNHIQGPKETYDVDLSPYRGKPKRWGGSLWGTTELANSSNGSGGKSFRVEERGSRGRPPGRGG